jgi:hypothetical protein
MSKNSIDEFYKSLGGGLKVLRWDCQSLFLYWPVMACFHARVSEKHVPDSIRIYRLVIDGFNPRLDFSHRPRAVLDVSAIDAVHEVILWVSERIAGCPFNAGHVAWAGYRLQCHHPVLFESFKYFGDQRIGDNGTMPEVQHPACTVALIAHMHRGQKSSSAWRHWIMVWVAKASMACQSIQCAGASCEVAHIWKRKSETEPAL